MKTYSKLNTHAFMGVFLNSLTTSSSVPRIYHFKCNNLTKLSQLSVHLLLNLGLYIGFVSGGKMFNFCSEVLNFIKSLYAFRGTLKKTSICQQLLN